MLTAELCQAFSIEAGGLMPAPLPRALQFCCSAGLQRCSAASTHAFSCKDRCLLCQGWRQLIVVLVSSKSSDEDVCKGRLRVHACRPFTSYACRSLTSVLHRDRCKVNEHTPATITRVVLVPISKHLKQYVTFSQCIGV